MFLLLTMNKAFNITSTKAFHYKSFAVSNNSPQSVINLEFNISKNIRIGWIGLYIVHFLRMPRLAKLGDFLEFFRRLGEILLGCDCITLCKQ